MESIDALVLRRLCAWRLAGKRALLVTVIRTWGSSPRPVGSIMSLCEDGTVVGSVSGGCIEEDLIYRYTHAEQAEPLVPPGVNVTVARYGVEADEAHRFGLPCGGTLELLLEADPVLGKLSELLQWLKEGHQVRRTVDLRSGVVKQSLEDLPKELAITSSHVSMTFGPAYRMLLIGAGQLTEYLATMAIFNGFAVTVCDPRVEYMSTWQVQNVQLVSGMPDDVVLEFRPDSRSCVVALTHDPKLDDMALLEALHSQAFYVGAIGSRRNDVIRRDRMIQYLDQTQETLDRLRSPVGIYIGSKTPAEIAVSIMAEIIAVKNNVSLDVALNIRTAKEALVSETY